MSSVMHVIALQMCSLQQSVCWNHDRYVFVIRALSGRVLVVASGLQDGESGSSS